jgi:hypothetical protein
MKLIDWIKITASNGETVPENPIFSLRWHYPDQVITVWQEATLSRPAYPAAPVSILRFFPRAGAWKHSILKA